MPIGTRNGRLTGSATDPLNRIGVLDGWRLIRAAIRQFTCCAAPLCLLQTKPATRERRSQMQLHPVRTHWGHRLTVREPSHGSVACSAWRRVNQICHSGQVYVSLESMDQVGKREPDLTPRQREVLALLDRRMTHKQIANELEISTARVSQYVRAIKDRMGVETLAQVVERYRALEPADPQGYKEVPSQSFQLPDSAGPLQPEGGSEPARLLFSDVQPNAWPDLADEERTERIVPGVLDGKHAVVARIGVIVAVSLGFMIFLIVAITAAGTLSNLLSTGMLSPPPD